MASPPGAAFASLDPNDMGRFKKALVGVDYLLDNWTQETTECGKTGEGVCTDSPDKVRYYFGLRTTDHPLFNLDKLYAAAQKKLPDDVDFEAWIDATEALASQIAKINELAYTYVAAPRLVFPPCSPLPTPAPVPTRRIMLALPGPLLASTIPVAARSRYASISSFARNRLRHPRKRWRSSSSC